MNVVLVWVLVLGIPITEPVMLKARNCEDFATRFYESGWELKDGYTLVCSEGNLI